MSATASRIDRVRVVAPHGTNASALRPRLRHVLAHWLDTAEAQRHDLPSDAIVLIRQVKASWRAVQQTGQATVQPPSLSAALHSAQHGLTLSGAPTAAGCPAVWFGNEAEVLAGLARDALSGSLAQRWWWRQLVGCHVHDEVVQQRWVASPRHVPLALSLLHTERQDTPWLRHMAEGHREAMLQALASAFPTDAAVLAWVHEGRHGVLRSGGIRNGTVPTPPPGPDEAERLARLCATWLNRPQDAAHGASFLARHPLASDVTDPATDHPTGHAHPTEGIGPQDAALANPATHADPRAAPTLGAAPGHATDPADFTDFSDVTDATAQHAGHTAQAQAATSPAGQGGATDPAHGSAGDNAPGPGAHDGLAEGEPPQPHPHAPMRSSNWDGSDGHPSLAPTLADAPAHTGPATDPRALNRPGSAAPSPEDAAQALNHAAPPTLQPAHGTVHAPDANSAHMAAVQAPSPGPTARWDTATPRAAARTDTPHAGLFFLLNAAIGLGWYGDFTQPQHQGLSASPWQFLRAAGQTLVGHSWRDDPLHAWLMTMDPKPLPHTALRPLWPPLRARLALALGPANGMSRTQAVQLTVRLPGQVRLRPGRVDVHAPLAQLPLAVRMAGLDRDIGWLPAAGLDIRFHFEAGTP